MAGRPLRRAQKHNPRPIPLNPETVDAIFHAVEGAFELARHYAHKNDLLYHAFERVPASKLPRGKRKGEYVVGTFPIPVYRGSKFAPLYREVPVVLYPVTDEKLLGKSDGLAGGHIPVNTDDPTADLEYLAIQYNAIEQASMLPHRFGYSFEYALKDTIVHEMTHAADFFRLRKHVPSGALRKEKGYEAYYNQPMEVRAFMQAAVRGLKHDLQMQPKTTLEQWLKYARIGGMREWWHLTPANQRKFLQALYQAEQDFREQERGK